MDIKWCLLDYHDYWFTKDDYNNQNFVYGMSIDAIDDYMRI